MDGYILDKKCTNIKRGNANERVRKSFTGTDYEYGSE